MVLTCRYYLFLLLGAPSPVDTELDKGDRVKVELGQDVFKMMQTISHGGWSSEMANVNYIVIIY